MEMFDTKAVVDRMAIKKETTWEPLSLEELSSITLGDIINMRKRFMCSLVIGIKKIYVVSCKDDETAVRAKYPGSTIININQLAGLFRKCRDEMDYSELAQAFLVMDVFPGAEIIS